MYGSRIIHKDRKMDLVIGEDSEDSDTDLEDMYAIRKGQDFKQVKGMPGMFYKVYSATPNLQFELFQCSSWYISL